MSGWLGTGKPQARVAGEVYTFPACDAGGRKEIWDPVVDESWENILGEIIDGALKFRFRGEYTWSALSDAEAQRLVTWRNQRTRLTWRPHEDVGILQMLVRIVDVVVEEGGTVHAQNKVTLKVEAPGLVTSIPVPDGYLAGFRNKGIRT